MPEPVPSTDAVVTQRARLHTLLQRRRRLWRRIVILVVATVVIVLMALLNRDTLHLRAQRKVGQMVAAALQKEFEDRRDPPLMFPSGKDRQEEQLERELKELEREDPESEQDPAELERRRREVERELEPLVLKRRQFEQERQRHYFNMFYVSQRKLHPEGEVGVCCFEKPVRFYVRTEGRIVILFDGEHFNSYWMPESEFRTKAEQLGFGNLLRK